MVEGRLKIREELRNSVKKKREMKNSERKCLWVVVVIEEDEE
jgi:hypothetical protein